MSRSAHRTTAHSSESLQVLTVRRQCRGRGRRGRQLRQYRLLAARPPVAPQPIHEAQRAKVDDLDNAEQRDAHKEAQQAATVGHKVGNAEQFSAFKRDEVVLLEEDHDVRVRGVTGIRVRESVSIMR